MGDEVEQLKGKNLVTALWLSARIILNIHEYTKNMI